MPSTYVGDATLAESPSPAPSPISVPQLTLPSPGDGDTAASVAQAYKALANEVTWLKTPRGVVGNWNQPLRKYENARQQNRFLIDHMGYPAGDLIAYDEYFDRYPAASAFPTSFDALGWRAVVGTGNVTLRPPGGVPANPLFPKVELAPSTALNDTSLIWRIGSARANTNDLGLSLRWKACLSEVGANRTTVVMGLTDAAASAGTDPPIYGAYFRKTSADTNWQCYFKTQSGTLSSVDSGFLMGVGVFQDFRIEIMGTNVADDSVSAIRYYINDLLAATLLVDVSTLAGTSINPLSPYFAAQTTTAAGANFQAWIAAVKYRQNMSV
jgi:hypothetical protein